MAEVITVHGGPWHGRITSIPDGRDHFHILQPTGEPRDMVDDPEATIETLPIKEGMYSRVGSTHDFEWDGWRSHD